MYIIRHTTLALFERIVFDHHQRHGGILFDLVGTAFVDSFLGLISVFVSYSLLTYFPIGTKFGL